ncbi:MAG: triacylglycerol lipase [Pseudomonadales bacterium]|nr:triacylglycerol lipase [Pseudomonadales bacterium]
MKISNSLLALSTVAAFSLSSVAQAATHSGYVPHEEYPAAPVNNCAWWNAPCKAIYVANVAAHIIEKEAVDIRNYNNRYNTAYPIVLVHGVSGFDQILGGIEYFQGIPASLRAGNAVVYTPNVTAWNTAEVRGEQLLDYIVNTVLPETGASKVNIIGHSLGGPTSRYVAGVRPDLVESVTTVNATNYGSGFADYGVAELLGTAAGDTILSILSLSGDVLDALAGNAEYDQDALETIKFMSTERALTFNEQFPAGEPTEYCGEGPSFDNGIHFFSWGSHGKVTNPLDVSDALLAFTSSLGYWNGEPDDGLVGICSMHWGDVIRDDYSMNHLDATNLLFGLHNILETNPKTLFDNHASRLRGMNL